MNRRTMTAVVSRYCLTPGQESMAQSPASFSACRRRHVGHKQSLYCAARRAPVSAVNETTSHQHPPAQQTKRSPQAAHRFSRRIVVRPPSFIAALCSNVIGRSWPTSVVYRVCMTLAERRSPEADSTGLCADCQHARHIESVRGSVFVRCEWSTSDPTFLKYPRLPVLLCSAHAPSSRPDA